MKINSSSLKRILAMLLVVVMIIGVIPTSVIAAAADTLRSSSYMRGDLNDDGDINAKDSNLLRQCIAGYDGNINKLAADINADGAVDAKDSNLLRQYLAGIYDIEQPDSPSTYSVNFYDGERLIDTLTAEKNQPLGAVP
ncbi:MAG: dockerin type I repeat-containing protein, partial [Clostridia bacterium]|nr:dockerin type I repeat-containing protein [Clostridia bacterium]